MNKSDMKTLQRDLETVLGGVENDIYRLQGIVALAKDAITTENCEVFEHIFNAIMVINDTMECVEFLKRR